MSPKWKPNQTIIAAKDWDLKFLGMTYLVYALFFGVSDYILSRFSNLNELVRLLTAYFITTIICLIFVILVYKKPLKSLGMETNQMFNKMFIGWIYAAISLLFVFLSILVTGGISVSINTNVNWLWFFLLLIAFVFQGFMEEFLTRGIIFTYVAKKSHVFFAIIANSAIFALGHVFNQGASFISILNTFLFGVSFSIIFYYHDNLWLVSGFHSGWNFILGVVLGAQVSGFELPTFLLKTNLNKDMEFINGGAYGFEASIFVTILTIGIIGFYIWLIEKKNNLQMKQNNFN